MTGDAEPRARLDRAPQDVNRHGLAEPRGQTAPSNLPRAGGGRFGRMFPVLAPCRLSRDATEALATAMVKLEGKSDFSTRVSAGYTYLGQFIDHDITFDATSSLERNNDPFALRNFRTPRFDLDSLYGSGPADQPFLYDWTEGTAAHAPPGTKLLIGRNPRGRDLASSDLPRNWKGRALVGDARNDENLIIAQLHLLFIRFHNKVVDRLLKTHGELRNSDLFDTAQRTVRWHYQWIVMHDFLRRITGFRVPPARRQFVWSDEPFIPVEFSGAAYRFGHSMVREDYRLNDQHGNVPIFPRRGMPDDLGGLRWLPARLQIDWHRFFKVSGTPTQSSMRIDTSLARALTHVPPTMLALARLNLRRGRALGLPAGRDVAETLGIDPVDGDELVDRVKGHLSASERTALRRSTPLWFYILREAELRGAGGLWLGPVGSRIVSEVLTGLLEADPSSYVRQRPGWKPELPCKTSGDFTMPDLVRFTLGS